MTMMCMALVAVFLAAAILLRDAKGKTASFFDLSATSAMRGFWCLIIALVHVPEEYQNPLQDLMGSFAYIGVTFFFMTSGYGLMLGVRKNGAQSMTKGFWRKRLPKLLVPLLLVNIAHCAAVFVMEGKFEPLLLIGITGFVRQLLLFYFLTWLVFVALRPLSDGKKMAIVCVLVGLVSIALYVCSEQTLFAWPVESLGYLYGILLAMFSKPFCEKMQKKWMFKCAVLCIAAIGFGVAYLKFKELAVVGDYALKALLGAALTVFILAVNVTFSLSNAVSRFLGRISYEVYLIHGLVFTCLQTAYAPWNSGVYILCSLLVTVAAAAAVNGLSSVLLRLFKRRER